jgi:hypothetical protein
MPRIKNDRIESLKKQAKRLGYSSYEGLITHGGKVTPKGCLSFDHKFKAEIHAFEHLSKIERTPGLYQIFTFEGTPLKVGISNNLQKRLKAHARSKQKYLQIKDNALGELPSDIVSKRSILAKHLFFDNEITSAYDLRTELGRQAFLKDECYLEITYTNSREIARKLEVKAEKLGIFRYRGRVIKRG